MLSVLFGSFQIIRLIVLQLTRNSFILKLILVSNFQENKKGLVMSLDMLNCSKNLNQRLTILGSQHFLYNFAFISFRYNIGQDADEGIMTSWQQLAQVSKSLSCFNV